MNQRRAGWAKAALEWYARATGIAIEREGLATCLHDLLCDLRHLAAQNGISEAEWWSIGADACQDFTLEVLEAEEAEQQDAECPRCQALFIADPEGEPVQLCPDCRREREGNNAPRPA